MYSEILVNIETKRELQELVQKVEGVVREVGSDDSKVAQTITKHIKEPIASAIVFATKKSPAEELTKLNQYLKDLEELKLTLSFRPKADSLEKIVSWVKQNVGKEIVLEIDTDESILGGVILSYKGKYKDYSLKKMFEEGGLGEKNV